MSRNISLLSGKKDDKNSLFGKISVSPNEPIMKKHPVTITKYKPVERKY